LTRQIAVQAVSDRRADEADWLMLTGLGLGGTLFAAIALIVWIIILVWLAARVLRFVGLKTSWGPLDPRNLGLTVTLLGGAIHLGNWAVDWAESLVGDIPGPGTPGIPSAFLIGSVAIATGIAGARWHRKQKPKGD